MKVLFVTSEAAPFAASGGLGDVMGALPQALYDEGVDVEVILPLYDTIKDEFKSKMKPVIDISFDLSWRKTGARIYKYIHKSVVYYFVENHYYFDRGSFYGQSDDIERFAFFSKAVIEFILAGGTSPDILHANDWQSAAAIIYLKTMYARTASDRKAHV